MAGRRASAKRHAEHADVVFSGRRSSSRCRRSCSSLRLETWSQRRRLTVSDKSLAENVVRTTTADNFDVAAEPRRALPASSPWRTLHFRLASRVDEGFMGEAHAMRRVRGSG